MLSVYLDCPFLISPSVFSNVYLLHTKRFWKNPSSGRLIVFSYLMVAGAIDWNICPEVLGMTTGQMFQSIAPETIK
jgi:hypothetical protein